MSWYQWDGAGHYRHEQTPGESETEEISLDSVVSVRKFPLLCCISACLNGTCSSKLSSSLSVQEAPWDPHFTDLTLIRTIFAVWSVDQWIDWLVHFVQHVFVTHSVSAIQHIRNLNFWSCVSTILSLSNLAFPQHLFLSILPTSVLINSANIYSYRFCLPPQHYHPPPQKILHFSPNGHF